jgi:hypothetical protein
MEQRWSSDGQAMEMLRKKSLVFEVSQRQGKLYVTRRKMGISGNSEFFGQIIWNLHLFSIPLHSSNFKNVRQPFGADMHFCLRARKHSSKS